MHYTQPFTITVEPACSLSRCLYSRLFFCEYHVRILIVELTGSTFVNVEGKMLTF